jgi:hypothetical protein
VIGLDAEKAANIGHGVRAMAAVNQATVPWCTVIPAQRLRRGRRRIWAKLIYRNTTHPIVCKRLVRNEGETS